MSNVPAAQPSTLNSLGLWIGRTNTGSGEEQMRQDSDTSGWVNRLAAGLLALGTTGKTRGTL